jgi:hypothetical protein
MNPAVMAAIVGVSGTVIVGVAGFWASARNTSKTIALARESRIWDQRAAIYVEVLAYVNYRQRKRELETRVAPMPDEERQREQRYLDSYKAADWHELEARLQAFASDAVFMATLASVEMDQHAIMRFEIWQTMDNVAMAQPSESGREMLNDVHTSLAEARVDAHEADRAVIELIRAALQELPQPVRWHSTLGLPDPLRGPSR